MEGMKMRARCVDNENVEKMLTVGKVYEIVEDATSSNKVLCDDGEWRYLATSRFDLIPDAPAAPKSDWMQMKSYEYVSFVSGVVLHFYKSETRHYCQVRSGSHLFNCDNDGADSFAALVGYEWPKGE
jgi:hypothetical protein